MVTSEVLIIFDSQNTLLEKNKKLSLEPRIGFIADLEIVEIHRVPLGAKDPN